MNRTAPTSMEPRGTILIVDDSADNLGFLLEHLSEAQYRVLVALSGQEALTRLRKTSPDLILLDAMMPGVDGFETCARIKREPEWQDIPVIFMSALTESADKLEGFKRGAVDYITKPVDKEEVLARVNTHVSLRKLQQELEKRNAELHGFARMVAHDLRNPLATIMGFSDLLLATWRKHGDGAVVRARDIEAMHTISRSSRAMNNTIDAVLLLAGISRDTVELTEVDPNAILAEVQSDLSAMIEEHRARLIVADEFPAVLGYAPWLQQVWCNLLSNGIKYGGDPPVLELGATQGRRSMVTFWVRDNGHGIPEEALDKIFQPFARLDRTSRDGHGIGLSIVESVISKLGGTVAVRNLPAGGSEFSFTLRSAGVGDDA